MRNTLALSLFAVHLFGCAASSGEAPVTEQLATEAPEIQAPRQGSGVFEGAVDGRTLTIADARILTGPLSSREPIRHGVRIVLADRAGLCDRPDVTHPGEQTLGFELEFQDGVLAVGAYTVPVAFGTDTATVVARLDTMSPTCSNKAFMAIGGQVTIDEVDATHARGTFELKLGRETVRGTFDAVPCEGKVAPPLAMKCER